MGKKKTTSKTSSLAQNTFLRKRFVELLGIGAITLAVFLTVALTTYNQHDPSLDYAINARVANKAGEAGAYIAGPVLNMIGYGYLALVLVPLVWGIRLLRKQGIQRFWWRLAGFVLAVPALAAFAAVFDTSKGVQGWPYHASYGGFVGHTIREHSTALITMWGFAPLSIVLASLLLSFTCFFTMQHFSFAMGVKKRILLGIAAFLRKVLEVLAILKNGFTELVEGSEFDPDALPAPPVKETKPKRILGKKPDAPKEEPAPRQIVRKTKAKKDTAEQASFDLDMHGDYQMPPLSLLQTPKKSKNLPSESALSQNALLLEKVLEDYGVLGKIIEVQPGPVVTLYALEPAAGTKSARVIGLADDIARSMSAPSARIAVIPGRNAIGIELPNSTRETVYLKELLQADDFKKTKMSLPLALGKDIGGEPTTIDLAKTPHMLVAGTTGSGKSVSVNAMILSLLYKYSPQECKFIMIDPKMLELSVYQDIPHLLTPVVTEPGKAVVALKWTVKEMENRYRLMSNLGVRNITGYNEKISQAKARGEELTRSVQTGFDLETGKPIIEDVPLDMNPLPFIVVIVDEMADLMMVAGKDIEGSVQRLAQMARAAGIHVILATQRPSVDVVTGIIKANFPTRISFQVSSKIDSRTIIGEAGAEQLLGMGDMLYMGSGSKLTRLHGPFVDDNEVERIVSFIKKQGVPSYVDDVTVDDENGDGMGDMPGVSGDSEDDLYNEAVAIVLRDKKASTSYVQRQLKIGYNRAANLIEDMEQAGIISAPNHAGKREILLEDA